MLVLNSLEVVVVDGNGKPLHEATVSVSSANQTERIAAYDLHRNLYYFANLSPGTYGVQVQMESFEPESRMVTVQPRPTRVVIALIPSDSSFTWRGRNRIPFVADRTRIGLFLAQDLPLFGPGDDSVRAINTLLSGLNLEIESCITNDPEADWLDGEYFSTDKPVGQKALPLHLRVMALLLRFRDPVAGTKQAEVLGPLRDSPLIRSAGPLFYRGERSFAIFTSLITAAFRLDINAQDRAQLLDQMDLRQLSNVSHIPNGVQIEAASNLGYEINDIVSKLLDSELVDFAEVVMDEVPAPDGILPTNYLWPGAWDRKRVGAPNAWSHLRNCCSPNVQFGSPYVVLGIVDGVRSVQGQVRHVDFAGHLSNGLPKIYRLHDFHSWRADHDCTGGSHGLAVASIATGLSLDQDSGESTGGLAGIAPNVSTLIARYPNPEPTLLDMYEWMAGLDARSGESKFPSPIDPGADILCTPHGVGYGGLSESAKLAMQEIARCGRLGKGCLSFFSAGNNNSEVSVERPYGASEHTFSCAASTLSEHGEEVRAAYSGFSQIGVIEWCAPTSTQHGSDIVDNRPFKYGVWAANTYGKGNLPSFPAVQTFASQPPMVGQAFIWVDSTDGLAVGSTLLVGDLAGVHEVVQIASDFDPDSTRIPLRAALAKNHLFSLANPTPVVSGMQLVSTLTGGLDVGDTTLELSDAAGRDSLGDLVGRLGSCPFVILPPADSSSEAAELYHVSSPVTKHSLEVEFSPPASASYPAGSRLLVLGNGHVNHFGGTSASTPLCAGIAALVLSARPELTWLEVRQILRDTAVKIDLANTDFPWLDQNGFPISQSGGDPFYSNGLGYGRLDACEAVRAALEYRFSRDLMIRNHPSDTGVWQTMSTGNSPDIWVRSIPPESDPQAIPASYQNPGESMKLTSGQDGWIYIRVKNRGTEESLDFTIIVYVTSYQGRDFRYPDDLQPSNGIGNKSASEWKPATYLVGRIEMPPLKANADVTVTLPWNANLLPPKSTPQGHPWNPRLLVEITPMDGPLKGVTMADNNNMAEKRVEILHRQV